MAEGNAGNAVVAVELPAGKGPPAGLALGIGILRAVSAGVAGKAWLPPVPVAACPKTDIAAIKNADSSMQAFKPGIGRQGNRFSVRTDIRVPPKINFQESAAPGLSGPGVRKYIKTF